MHHEPDNHRFNAGRRREFLHEAADAYVTTAITNALQEYPHMPWIIASGPESYRTHRELHPAFFGSFDWHSCVEMHWVMVRLLRMFPDLESGFRARETLRELITPAHIEQETAFFREPRHRSFERPYGWGWLLKLWHETGIWDDPDGRRLHQCLTPLASQIMDQFEVWLPKMTYPQRIGMHANTAFGMSLAWDAVQKFRPALLKTFHTRAMDWFEADKNYPAHYEPSGADFLSAGLCEAELMSRLLPGDAFGAWLERFLPRLEQSEPTEIFTPAIVTDSSDGQIAHLHGLNLSRAWAYIRLAHALPADGDARIPVLQEAAEIHAAASLGEVVGSDYMAEHWLAAYATLLLSE